MRHIDDELVEQLRALPWRPKVTIDLLEGHDDDDDDDDGDWEDTATP